MSTTTKKKSGCIKRHEESISNLVAMHRQTQRHIRLVSATKQKHNKNPAPFFCDLPIGPPYGAAAIKQSLRPSFRFQPISYSSIFLFITKKNIKIDAFLHLRRGIQIVTKKNNKENFFNDAKINKMGILRIYTDQP